MGNNIDEGDLSIHHIVFDGSYSKILYEDTIVMMDRSEILRKLINNQIYILFVLENNSEIGIIKLN